MLQVLDIVFVVVFSIEAVLKILVKGVLFTGPDAYMRNAWNVLDFIVVVTGGWCALPHYAGALSPSPMYCICW